MANVNIPAGYSIINQYNAGLRPSTVHDNENLLTQFFARYYLQKCMSVFDFDIPEEWDETYFLYTLFLMGFIAVINTDKYGTICQRGTPYGRGIYLQPTNIIITNPLLTQTYRPEIGRECSVIKLQPDWLGVYDIVYQFASMSALAWQAAGVNLINSHLAYVFMAENKASAESFKKMYDEIASGQPAQFADKKLFSEDGDLRVTMLNQNLKQTYITGDILSDQAKIENMFNTRIGIPNANFEKSERLISDEVNANNSDTQALCSLWLETMKKGMQQTRSMFNINIDVKYKFNYQNQNGGDNGSDTLDARDV